MEFEKKRIIFMGTPLFAVESLKKLVENGFNVVAVVTAPDKPAGRGKKLQCSDVKEYALSENLKILQPTNLKSPDFINELKELNPDLQIVVAFRMLPESVWSLPPLGTFNLHASLLPQYRGAAPINHAIINGEKKTGVTTFLLNKEIDCGEIIDYADVEISNEDNAGTLHDKLMEIGSDLLISTTKKILSGNFQRINQSELVKNNGTLKEAPKIFKDFCKINFENDINYIYNFVRGLAPYPGAYIIVNIGETDDIVFKVFKVSVEIILHHELIGTLHTDNKNFIKIAVKEGFINILELQMMGKKRMLVKDFLNGFKFFDTKVL
jgi:methionyl-tRNA formyltransferase